MLTPLYKFGFHFVYSAACYCSVAGSVSSVCANGAGICQCRPGYTGDKCDSCTSPGQFYATNAGCTGMIFTTCKFFILFIFMNTTEPSDAA